MNKLHGNIKDLSGKKFGRLTVLRYSHTDVGSIWVCLCKCGKTVIVKSKLLSAGKTKSCGCLINDISHDLVGTRVYSVWSNMKSRCLNPKTKCFNYYGGKGISVCDEWLDFKKFYKWASANGYKDSLTIDRKDSSKNYCPDNCRWISFAKNNRNRKGAYKNSTTGVRGVYFHKSIKKWIAGAQYKKKTISKCFDSFELACSNIDRLREALKNNVNKKRNKSHES